MFAFPIGFSRTSNGEKLDSVANPLIPERYDLAYGLFSNPKAYQSCNEHK
jgi:hypothetical protein